MPTIVITNSYNYSRTNFDTNMTLSVRAQAIGDGGRRAIKKPLPPAVPECILAGVLECVLAGVLAQGIRGVLAGWNARPRPIPCAHAQNCWRAGARYTWRAGGLERPPTPDTMRPRPKTHDHAQTCTTNVQGEGGAHKRSLWVFYAKNTPSIGVFFGGC